MRSPRMLAAVALLALMTIALAFTWFRPRAKNVSAAAKITTPEPLVAAALPATSAPLRVRDGTNWGPEDRDMIAGYVELMQKSDAEFLCLTLGLIQRDEMFDDISYHRRLRRHVSRITTKDEFADMQAAFRQLTLMRGGTVRPSPAKR